VDTNSDPNIDFPIPGNDDASKSIKVIIDSIVSAIQEGLDERKATKAQEVKGNEKAEGEVEKTGLRPRKNKARKEITETTEE
jgi:small subunit ribosomal protein S2